MATASDGEFVCVKVATAAEVARGRALSDEARALLDADEAAPPRAYFDRLEAAGHHTDAELFLAHALPKREAVWWGCQCVRRVGGASPGTPAEAALKAAEAWVAAPGDANRRKTYPVAETAGFGQPAGCLALAAWLSGGSLAPANLTAVPPEDHLTGDCIAAALQVAAVLNDPTAATDSHRVFLELGRNVARGLDRWKNPT